MPIKFFNVSGLTNLRSSRPTGYKFPIGLNGNDDNPFLVDFLVVAGGGSGGGGTGYGGGGGAGGLRTSFGSTSGGGNSAQSRLSLRSSVLYTITVGAGGTFSGTAAQSGSNSSISGTGITTVTSIGGGRGASSDTSSATSGGSGGGGLRGRGGGAPPGTPYGDKTAGAGTANEGYAGGNAPADNTQQHAAACGGGGGAGGVGLIGVDPNISGNGGIGLAVSISGSSVYYAGGGGGLASTDTGNATPGVGGLGGGGNGGKYNRQTTGAVSATAGTPNTGGGGGGNYYAETIGTGGSGIVIISYTSATQLFTGGTVTQSGGNFIHTFTGDGTFRANTINFYIN
jgi:hypothetical protein